MRKVAVLGNGVTAKSVKSYLSKSKQFAEDSIENAELVVTSPGIPPYSWPKSSLEIISDIEFAFRIIKERGISPTIIGITGTNGKTTVASGLAHLLGVSAYGNIGEPLINHVDELSSESLIVLELSSFQLVSSPLLTCDIAIITNISEDHLEWHQSFEKYEKAKLSIVKSSEQVVILPDEYMECISMGGRKIAISSIKSTKAWFDEAHNQSNFAIIEMVANQLGISKTIINERLSSFQMPPFRFEKVPNQLGITIINDSKATNMGATLAAVNSCNKVDVLILSGQAKGAFSDSWADEILKKCKKIYVAGDLSKNNEVFPESMQSVIKYFSTLKQATNGALTSQSGGVVLFSPGAASFDEFENYLDRGRSFNQYIKEYEASKN